MTEIYEPGPVWAAYYGELDPKKRLALLEEALQSAPDDEAGPFRRRLYEKRYRDPKRPGRQVDNFLWNCACALQLYQNRHGLFFGFRRRAEKLLRDLCLDAPEQLTEAERQALYLELRNTARMYLYTCQDAAYGKKLMGLVAPSPEEKRDRITEDIWTMSRGIALAAGAEGRMALLCQAFHAALLDFDPECQTRYAALDAGFRK